MRLRIFIAYFLACLHILSYGIHADHDAGCTDQDRRGCSVFTLAKGNQVFFGGNDDYIDYDSYYWVDPGDSTRYGVIWIGQPDNVQQLKDVHRHYQPAYGQYVVV